MRWDSSRPVPWTRLMREWVLYVALMTAVFLLFFRDRNLIGVMTGLLISGPLYLGLGAVLAKLGYQRRSLRELRAEAGTSRSGSSAGTSSGGSTSSTATTRARPAPTRRTSTGPSQRPARSRRPRR